MDLYLAVGDTSLADALALDNLVDYRVPLVQVQGAGVSLPAGTNFGTHARGIYRTRGQPANTRMFTFPVLCLGSTINMVEANWAAIEDKLEQARQAATATGIGTPVHLWYRPEGASEFGFFVVVDGDYQYVDLALPDLTLYKGGILSLDVYPYLHSQPIIDAVSSTITNGTSAATLYRPNVPGRVEALTQVKITDVSTGVFINRIRLARKAVKVAGGAGSSNFSGIIAATPAGSGVAHADATAIGGTAARLTASTTLQQIATAFGSGLYTTGWFDVFGVIRDSSLVPLRPSTPVVSVATTGGNLPGGHLYSYLLTTRDASGNESLPTGAVSVQAPLAPTSFFDDFNSGQVLRWNSQLIAVSGGVYAECAPQTAAAFEGAYGLRAQAGLPNGAATSALAEGFLIQPFPGGSTTGQIRCKLRINSVAGAANALATIPLVLDGANNVVGTIVFNGSTWYLAGTSLGTSALALPMPNTGDWVTFEADVFVSGGNLQATIYINDTQVGVGNLGASTPAKFGVGAKATVTTGPGSAAAALSVDFDQVQISSSAFIGAGAGANTVVWAAGTVPAGGGYNLYFQEDGGSWRQVQLGNVLSYTHTSLSAGSIADPPSSAPPVAPSLWRLRATMSGAGPLTFQAGQFVQAQVANNKWELLPFGTFQLPPMPRQQGQSYQPWALAIDVESGGTNTPTVDIAAIVPIPHDSADAVVLEFPDAGNTTQKFVWQVDTRFDGRVSCALIDPNTSAILSQANARGQFMLGPGDNWEVVFAEVSDGAGNFVVDAVNCKFTVQNIIRPRAHVNRGTV